MAFSALLAPAANATPTIAGKSASSQAVVSTVDNGLSKTMSGVGQSSPKGNVSKGLVASTAQSNNTVQPAATTQVSGSKAAPRDGESQQATLELTLVNRNGTYDKTISVPVGQTINDLTEELASQCHQLGGFMLTGEPPSYQDGQGHTFYYWGGGLWNTNADGSGEYLPQKEDAMGYDHTGFTAMKAGAYHYYFVWEKYQVNFNFGDNSAQPSFGVYGDKDTSVEAPDVDGTYNLALSDVPAGKVFTGWNTKEDGTGTAYAPGSNVVVGKGGVDLTENTESPSSSPQQQADLYAQFSSQKTVNLDYGKASENSAFKEKYDNGHYGEMVVRNQPQTGSSVTYASKGKDMKLPQDGDFDKTFTDVKGQTARYQLVGWNVDPNSDKPRYKPGDTIKQADIPEDGLTLHAIWAQYKVRFLKGNAAAKGSMDNEYLYIENQSGDEADATSLNPVPDARFTLEGKAFDGWTNGTETYKPGKDVLNVDGTTEITRVADHALASDLSVTRDSGSDVSLDDIDLTAKWVTPEITGSVQPAEPSASIKPVEPAGPIQAVQLVGSVKPMSGQLASSIKPAKPAGSVQLVGSVKPMSGHLSASIAKPADPAKPVVQPTAASLAHTGSSVAAVLGIAITMMSLACGVTLLRMRTRL